jgi:hypothetical protein
MKTEHPITPPPELVQQWLNAPRYTKTPKDGTFVVQKCHSLSESEVIALVENAARWGADTELEACCEYEATVYSTDCADGLRRHRRPEPPSLKGKALDELQFSFSRGYLKKEAAETIRRALESLPD